MDSNTSLGHPDYFVVRTFPGTVLALGSNTIAGKAWETYEGPFPPGSLRERKAF